LEQHDKIGGKKKEKKKKHWMDDAQNVYCALQTHLGQEIGQSGEKEAGNVFH